MVNEVVAHLLSAGHTERNETVAIAPAAQRERILYLVGVEQRHIVGGVVGAFASGLGTGVGRSAIHTAKSIGNPFTPNRTVQIGVDPNTLKFGRALNPQKLKIVKQEVFKNGMYGVIEVNRNGIILDGNHRVAVAQILKIAVDVIIR